MIEKRFGFIPDPRLIIRLLLGAITLLTACERTGQAPPRQTLGTRPGEAAAWIDDFAISVQSVQLEAIAQGLAVPDKPLRVDSAEFSNILDQLIDQHLLSREAQKLALDASPGAQHKMASAHERILGNLLLERLIAQNVDEAALRKMYEAQRELMEPGEEVRLRHILLNSQTEAVRIVDRLAAGADFSELAASVSLDRQSAPHGGDLGYIRIDDAPHELRPVLRQLETDQTGEPTQTALGWHVLKIEDRRTRPMPEFADLRLQISRFLTLRTIDRELARLRGLSRINRLSFDGEDIDRNGKAIENNEALLDAAADLAGFGKQTEFSPASTHPQTGAPGPAEQKHPSRPSIHPARR